VPFDTSGHHPVAQDELAKALASKREIKDGLLPSALDFEGLDGSDAVFTGCVFDGVSVHGADLAGARCTDCLFAQARFASWKLNEVVFAKCTFYDAELKTGCTFSFCEMHDTELTGCNLTDAVFDRCDLYGVRAEGCGFRNTKFKGTRFQKAISRKVALHKATFDNCNFSYADLSGLSLKSCTLTQCKFSETLFWDTDLSEASLTGSIIDRAEWDRARLTKADLRGASLAGLNLAAMVDYAGLKISASQQHEVLREIGIDVHPD